ncbi:MAG: glycosyltransferase family 4 protein, partial [Actinomycetota bacterium]
MTHLLVTNDFPPKVGGIQSYLWELWRRLPPEDFVVHTTAYPGAAAWDAEQPFRVVRSDHGFLAPTPGVRAEVDRLAREVDADLVLLDPALPLGAIGPRLERPYGVVLHGAEVTVPGRLPLSRSVLGRVLRGAELVIAAGGYPAAEGRRAAGRDLPTVIVPPGVDAERFRPLDDEERLGVRRRHGLPVDGPLVVSVSRLVPRKGMDVLIEASARLRSRHPGLTVAIAGSGRDRDRLSGLVVEHEAPVRLLGRVRDEDLPGLYGAGDVFAMLCRTRWGGLEQEGFGIVFVEAGACAVAAIAGDSGGSAEAVTHGETGLVVDDPTSVEQVV